jgi:hypothetical protein
MGERLQGTSAAGKESGMVFHSSSPTRIDKLVGASKNSCRCTLGVNSRRLHQNPPVQPTKSPIKADEERLFGC